MANAYAGRRVGLVWGVVCAATLMNVQPFGLIDAWQFRHEPGWWAWTGYGLAIHLALVLGFVLVGGVMAREMRGGRRRSGRFKLRALVSPDRISIMLS